MLLFSTLTVISMIWVYDTYLEPALRKTKSFRMTLLRRQGGCSATLLGGGDGIHCCASRDSCLICAPHDLTDLVQECRSFVQEEAKCMPN
jgi:hypothetical protein